MEGNKVSTGKKIRRPGEAFNLTDEEVLASPIQLLSKAQRRHRRALKRRRKAADKNRAKRSTNHKIKCAGYRSDGEPCGSWPVGGAKHCMSHLDDAEKAKLGLKTFSEYGTEARMRAAEERRNANPVQTLREVMEIAQDKLINRQLRAVGLEFVGWDEEGSLIVRELGAEFGVCLHGVSKEGFVEMSKYPDFATQFGMVEKLFDRVYGRPRQTTVLEGGVKPVQVQPVRNPERAKRVAGLLHQAGAIPHFEGRRRSEPSEPAEIVEGTSESNVTPLRPDAE